VERSPMTGRMPLESYEYYFDFNEGTADKDPSGWPPACVHCACAVLKDRRKYPIFWGVESRLLHGNRLQSRVIGNLVPDRRQLTEIPVSPDLAQNLSARFFAFLYPAVPANCRLRVLDDGGACLLLVHVKSLISGKFPHVLLALWVRRALLADVQ
jgi:hypothetical protein